MQPTVPTQIFTPQHAHRQAAQAGSTLKRGRKAEEPKLGITSYAREPERDRSNYTTVHRPQKMLASISPQGVASTSKTSLEVLRGKTSICCGINGPHSKCEEQKDLVVLGIPTFDGSKTAAANFRSEFPGKTGSLPICKVYVQRDGRLASHKFSAAPSGQRSEFDRRTSFELDGVPRPQTKKLVLNNAEERPEYQKNRNALESLRNSRQFHVQREHKFRETHVAPTERNSKMRTILEKVVFVD